MKIRLIFVSLLAALLVFSSCTPPEGDVSGSVSGEAASENVSENASTEESGEASGEISEEISEESSDDDSKEYRIIESTRNGDFAVAVKVVSGKNHYAPVIGDELVGGFDYDRCSVLRSSGYVILINSDTNATALFTSDGKSVDRTYHDVSGGFELGDFRAAKKTVDGSARYALLSGGETIGSGAMLDGELITDFAYTSIKVLKYADYYGNEIGVKFILLKKADGSSEIRNSQGKLLVSGSFSEAVPMYGMLILKEGDKYVLYDGSGKKTGVPEFTNAYVETFMKYRIVCTSSRSGGVHYSAMNSNEDGALIAGDYDAKALSDRYYNKLIGVASEFVKAILDDDFDTLKELCRDDETVNLYKAALTSQSSDSHIPETVSGMLNIKKNYYGFDGAVKGVVFPEGGIFADEANGYFEIAFVFPLDDVTHPVTYYETMSFVSDGKGGFKVDAVENRLFTGSTRITFVTDVT